MANKEACPNVLDALWDMATVVCLKADQRILTERIGAFDAYLSSLEVRLDADLLRRADRLRVIATPSTGLDHIDLRTAAQRGVAVLSLRDDTDFLNGVTATAELAWALLLAVARRIPSAAAAARQGGWGRDAFRGHQLSGKTLGILGYGRLGRMVAEFGKGFRMHVLAHDVKPLEPVPGVTMISFPDLLREADVLSIHVHLTDENRGLIDSAALAALKPGAILINTSRGAIVDEAALIEALHSGRLRGAGLDVIDGEWEPNLAAHPLLAYARQHENLVITPHIGGVTHESQPMALRHTVAKLKTWLEAHS